MTNEKLKKDKMKEYTLIKMYPGSAEIGAEVIKDDYDKYITTNAFSTHIFTKDQVENFPEFWQEKEPQLYINLYKHGNNFLTQTFAEGEIQPNRLDFAMFTFKGTYKLTKLQ